MKLKRTETAEIEISPEEVDEIAKTLERLIPADLIVRILGPNFGGHEESPEEAPEGGPEGKDPE